MTRESLDGSGSTVQQTIDRMTLQIQETHEIAKQTLTQAQQTALIATDTHTLAEQAKVQAQQTTAIAATAQIANTNSLNADRPWVTISMADDRITNGTSEPSFVNLAFSNTGKRPALVVNSNFDEAAIVIRFDPPFPKDFPLPVFRPAYREAVSGDTFVVPPGGVVVKRFPHFGTPDNLFTSGAFRFYRYAFVDYTDPITGFSHSTSFCIYWNPNSAMTAKWVGCQSYNEAK